MRFRSWDETDFPRLAEVWNVNFPGNRINERELRVWESDWDPGRYDRLRLAAELQGVAVGFGEIAHAPWRFHPGHYNLRLLVDPGAEGRGVRRALFKRLMAALDDRAAERVHAQATDRRPDDLRFYLERGFQERQRMVDQRLDITRFEDARLSVLEPAGIEIITLAEEGPDDPAVRRATWQLDADCMRDVPLVGEFTPLGLEQWVARHITNERALPEAFFLAREGGAYVGLSFCQPSLEEEGVLWQQLTGVRREWRGRGVGRALKLCSIRYAVDHGYREIRTYNDVLNRAILALNGAVGFRPYQHWIELVKALPAGSE